MKKILLVDDDLFIRDFVSQKLLAAGFEVITCADGGEAFATALTETPDIILLDLDLPNRSGREILLELKATPTTVDIPVIIFSNNDDPDLLAEVKAAGATDFYMKAETDPEVLIEKICSIL